MNVKNNVIAGILVGLWSLLIFGCTSNVIPAATKTSQAENTIFTVTAATIDIQITEATQAYHTRTPTPNSLPTPDISPNTLKVLEHISLTKGVPIERLKVDYQHQRDYPFLEKSYWAVMALDTKTGDWYYVLLDLADGSIIDDPNTVEQAEKQARMAKNGKFDAALVERLNTATPDETIEVAIWVAGKPKHSQEELFELLAQQYPQAREALNRTGWPFDVGDYQLIMEMNKAYLDMLNRDTIQIVQPLVDYLQAKGYKVTTFYGIQMISAQLTKAAIIEVAERTDVGAINYEDNTVIPELGIATPSDRVP